MLSAVKNHRHVRSLTSALLPSMLHTATWEDTCVSQEVKNSTAISYPSLPHFILCSREHITSGARTASPSTHIGSMKCCLSMLPGSLLCWTGLAPTMSTPQESRPMQNASCGRSVTTRGARPFSSTQTLMGTSTRLATWHTTGHSSGWVTFSSLYVLQPNGVEVTFISDKTEVCLPVMR